MVKDKIALVIETLISTTESGNLIWDEDSSSYDRRYKRKMISVGEDTSLYELEIEYKLNNEKFILDKNPSLWIRNPKLPNGMFYIYGGNYVVKFGAFVGATEHGYNIIILVIVRHIEEHDYFSEIVRELDY